MQKTVFFYFANHWDTFFPSRKYLHLHALHTAPYTNWPDQGLIHSHLNEKGGALPPNIKELANSWDFNSFLLIMVVRSIRTH